MLILFIMAPKCRESTANVASKKPSWVIDLEMKLLVIKDYEGGKLSDGYCPSHSTTDTILKNKNKVMEAVQGSASSKAMRLRKFGKVVCQTRRTF